VVSFGIGGVGPSVARQVCRACSPLFSQKGSHARLFAKKEARNVGASKWRIKSDSPCAGPFSQKKLACSLFAKKGWRKGYFNA